MADPTTDQPDQPTQRSRTAWIIATAVLAVLLMLAVVFLAAYTSSSNRQRERNAKVGSCVAYGVGC